MNCYNPKRPGCKELAVALGGEKFPPLVAATMWGIYDDRNPDNPLNVSNAASAAATLKKFNRQLEIERASKVKTKPVEIAEEYRKLRKVMSSEERLNRVNMLVELFSSAVDSYREHYPNRSREEICRGFRTSEAWVAGETEIFEKLYKKLFNKCLKCKGQGYKAEALALEKVLDNWPALVSLARVKLRDVESIKLGYRSKLAVEALAYDFGENNIDDLFSEEESKREGWQEIKEALSSFGSLGPRIRAVLGRLYLIGEDGKIITDDLGCHQRMNPMQAHQVLQRALRGMTSSRDMMNKLNRMSVEGTPWISELITLLNKDPQLRTQFYVKYKKDWQVYSILKESFSNGVRTFKTIIANKKDDSNKKAILTNYKIGANATSKTIYDSSGNVNWKNVQSLRTLIKDYFYKNPNSPLDVYKFVATEKVNGRTRRVIDKENQIKIVKDILEHLGIFLSNSEVESFISKRNNLNKLSKELTALLQFGIDAIIQTGGIKTLESGNNIDTSKADTFLRKKPSGQQKAPIQEHLEKIADLTYEYTFGELLESSARYITKDGKGITMYSDVTPSYLGTFIGDIQRYVDSEDIGGIKAMLNSKFLDSPMFKKGDEILNWWMRDLYNSELGKNSFADNIEFKRFLGENGHPFENFTAKQHMINLWTEFWGPYQQSNGKSEYAYYPTFILGDSGVSKFIKAKIYNIEDLKNGFYDVYRQEIIRMATAKSVEADMKSKGLSTLEAFSSKKNEFTNLVFLNENFKGADGSIGKYAKIMGQNPSKEAVIKAIDAYMNDCIKEFKNELQRQGLLNKVSSTVYDDKSKMYIETESYEYFSQNAKNEQELDSAIETYYWNSKFAMIQQLQLMTIDPGFYFGTKDLQKRYKEIHAPGEVLDIYAVDSNGDYYGGIDLNNNGDIRPETAIYINDIKTNVEKTNPELASALLDNFGEEGREAYNKYLKNNLTDGQGWRTLDGYRKVMGMLGEWTEVMEDAYNKIKALRKSKDSSGKVPIDKLQEIAKLAVVFQPIKPFMFTIENYPLGNGQFLKIPVQHKYSESVLIPELLNEGSALRDLAEYMENHTDDFGEPDPIDLACATSCVKVGSFGAVSIDNLSQYDNEIIKSDGAEITNKDRLHHVLGKAYVHRLSYYDYRKQTNVPKHMDSSQLFGTQIRKIIMSGLDLDGDYSGYVSGKLVDLGGNIGSVRLNGRNLINFYNSLITSNILESLDEFENLISSPEKVSELLEQSVIDNARESEDNMIAFSLESDGLFTTPLCEGGLEHDSAALLLSMFKKRVNKQKIKGGSFVQASAFGISGYEEDGGLKFVVDPNDKSNILYAECEIPFEFSYTDAAGNKVELDYYDYVNEDGTPKVGSNGKTLLEERFPGILDFIAYRIPTERHYSMMNLKVVRFSHKEAGGTIKVPAEGTTIAGFDFDIDKLYFMRREYVSKQLTEDEVKEVWELIYKENPGIKTVLQNARKVNPDKHTFLHEYWEDAKSINQTAKALLEEKNKIFQQYVNILYQDNFSTYDFKKTPLENSRVDRNNMLIDLMQKRLMDKETIKSRITPGGFTNNSAGARIMRELEFGNLSDIKNGDGSINWEELDRRTKDEKSDPEPEYDPSDPLTLIRYNQQNQIASKLIGIFANQNANHAFASLMEEFYLVTPIEFAEHTKAEGYGYNLLKGPRGVDTSLAIAELLAASVDAVKDPVLNYLNLNSMTANAGALLARLGYSPTEIGLLFNQPIIKDICEYAFNEGILDHDAAIKHITNQYSENYGASITINSRSLTKDKMANNIILNRETKDKSLLMKNSMFVESQLQAASLFSTILASAKEVTSFIQATKFTAANAVGSTFGDLYAQQLRVADYINSLDSSTKKVAVKVAENHNYPVSGIYLENAIVDKGKLDKEEYINSILNNPFAYEQAMYDANRRALKALNKYYPYDTSLYSGVRDYIGSITKTGVLDAETINTVHTDLMVFILSTLPNSNFNGSTMTSLGMNRRDYYKNKFPVDLGVFKETFANSADDPLLSRLFIESNDDGDLYIRLHGALNSDPRTKDSIREAWINLHEKHPEISEGLFFYNFFNTGFTFGPTSFMHLAPTEVKSSLVVYGDDSNVYTYRDVLNKIIEGSLYNSSAELNKEFTKQFILNHLDNYRLAFTPNNGSPIANLLYKEAVTTRGALTVYKDSFTIDLSESKWKNKEFYVTHKVDNKKREYTFKPCIVINGVPYICDVDINNINNDGSPFNITSGSPKMTYYKAEVLGKKNVAVRYDYRLESDISQQVQPEPPQEFVPGTTQEGEFNGSNTEVNREELENEIIQQYTEAYMRGGMEREEVNSFMGTISEVLKSQSDNVLQEYVKAIRQSIKENGVLVLDENGNPKLSC